MLLFKALYSKTTQTEDERFSCGEFSFGSQELYIEDEMNMDGYIRGTVIQTFFFKSDKPF